MAMTTSATADPDARVLPLWLAPAGWVGGFVVGSLAYLGGVAMLLLSAMASLVSLNRDEDLPGFWAVMRSELGWLLMMGIPMVGLVHVGMGSTLSMQAYFGSTFVDGTGAVVGVGLLRNVASMATGMTLSGLIAFRTIPVRLGLGADPVPRGYAGRMAAPRLVAAGLATVLLSLWGFVVGTFIGWRAAGTMMGLSSNMYFVMFYRMIWFRDVIGLIVKGLLFGVMGAAISCHEGLLTGQRLPDERAGAGAAWPGVPGADFSVAILRASCLSMMAILLLNMTWFLLVYHAVPVFGPSLLQPPSQ